MKLDPASQHVMDLFVQSGRPAVETLTPVEARAAQIAGRPILLPDPPPVALMRNLAAPGPAGPIPIRLYRGADTPPDALLPCLVYYHGGGWVVCDLDSHDWVCRRLANLAGCAVVSVDYRLAPEHKFPAAVEDCAAATAFVAREGASLGIDTNRIAVGGDSAGGNLAAVMALMARDGALPPLVLQLLFYPAVDFSRDYPSYQAMAEGYLLTTAAMRWFGAHYLNGDTDRVDWRASPIRASSLAEIAPAYVLTCTYDPLCDEGIAYAARLREAGVSVVHDHVADQMHAFLVLGRLVPAAYSGTEAAAFALRSAFGSPARARSAAPTRRLISSGSDFERHTGYSRAVVDGDDVFVAGTTGFDYATMTIAPDVAAQTRQTFANIARALDEAGSSLADVVRARYYVPDHADWDAASAVIGEHFGNIRPAATAVFCGLVDPRMRIEIEVTARRRG